MLIIMVTVLIVSDGLSGQSQEDNSDGEEYLSTNNPESTTNQH